jgi:hypothetical protein
MGLELARAVLSFDAVINKWRYSLASPTSRPNDDDVVGGKTRSD